MIRFLISDGEILMVNINGVTNKVPFCEVFEFTKEEIALVFECVGLMNAQESCQIEPMDKFVFLHGDEQEVYNKEERNFIESVGNMYIYREFHKKTKRGVMPCRIIAAEINAVDEIKNSLFFMKEINKAIGGFTIFFIKAGNDYYIGIRAFNKDLKDDCIISMPIVLVDDFEEMAYKLSYVSQSDNFIDYYNSFVEAIACSKTDLIDYDTQIIIKRGIQYSYLNMLNEISHVYKVDFIGEIERYYESFENNNRIDYVSMVKESISELSFIESFKANTMEMLFEAEEMEQLAIKTEEENDVIIEKESMNNSVNNEESDSEMKEYLDDPELMIKMLKQRKGI